MWEEEKRYLKGLGGDAEESFMEGWEIIANSLTEGTRKMSGVRTEILIQFIPLEMLCLMVCTKIYFFV